MAPAPTNTKHPNHPPLHHSDYPRELSSFLHSHLLTLMIRNPLVPSRTRRICDVCRESIDGDFYGCNHCHFHVHPYCTHLPKSLRHVIDPTHKLRLHKLSAGRCSVCKADCSSLWVYGCHDCRVNVHLRCLLKPLGSREKTDQLSGSRGIHHHHHAPPPPWVTEPPHFHGGFPAGGWDFPHGYGWEHPSNHFGYPGPVQFAHNNHPSHHPNHGGHGHGHGQGHGQGHGHGQAHGHGHCHGHEHAPSSSLGSLFSSTMFSLVGNLAIGALTDFIFGSIGF